LSSAPTALKAHKIGYGKAITSYPDNKPAMLEGNHYKYKEDRVVIDGKCSAVRSF
jgi:putative intracellular protease/amidase